MATYTKEYEKVVKEETEVVECDYCRMFTTEDVDEPFHKVLLDPKGKIDAGKSVTGRTTIRQVGIGSGGYELVDAGDPYYSSFIRELAQVRTPEEVWDMMVREITVTFSEAADLCPGCAKDLFGPGPASGIRRGYEEGENDP